MFGRLMIAVGTGLFVAGWWVRNAPLAMAGIAVVLFRYLLGWLAGEFDA